MQKFVSLHTAVASNQSGCRHSICMGLDLDQRLYSVWSADQSGLVKWKKTFKIEQQIKKF